MDNFFLIFVGLLVCATIYWVRYMPNWLRTVFFLTFLVGWYGTNIEYMGAAKPLHLEWRDLTSAKVLAYRLVPDKSIHLWVEREGVQRLYRMEWDRNLAQQIQDSMQATRGGTNGKVTINKGKQGGQENPGKYFVQPDPPPPLPEKDR